MKELKSVLIVFSSRFGSTYEIAQEIAEELEKFQILTEIINLGQKEKIPPLEEFDGILVGSGIKAGEWTREARDFLKENQNILNTKIVGLFVSSGEAANPEMYLEARKKYLDKIMEETGVIAEMAEAFGGVFDLSTSSNYSFQEKKLLERVVKSIRSGIIIQDGKINDYRNWQLIRNWATDFSQLVKVGTNGKKEGSQLLH